MSSQHSPTIDKTTVPTIASNRASKSASKIAIVGLATQYPDADNPQTFWQNLLDKKDSRTQISHEKLNANPADYQGVQVSLTVFTVIKAATSNTSSLMPRAINCLSPPLTV